MRGSVRAAAAIGAGYLLGRRRKLRTAALLAAATAIGGKGAGGLVLQRGIKMLSSTETFGTIAPQLGEITDTVRDDLVVAAKAAATAAVSNRVDSLTNSIHQKAERLRNPGEVVTEAAGEATGAAGTAGRAASSGARRAASTAHGAASRVTGRRGPDRDQDEDDYDTDDLAAREGDDEDRAEPGDYEEDERAGHDEPDDDMGEPADDEAAEPDHDEQESRGRGRAAAPGRRGAGQRRSPVSRARR